jgi:RND family efflux transporter MFP subunit
MTATEERRRRPAQGGRAALVVVVAAAALAGYGIWTRENAVAALTQRADDASIPRVQLIAPKSGPATRSLTLPGNINAWYEAPLYAQVAGYVKMWYKDYGATVKSGELLASIDSPTVDAELAAAQANLAVAQTRYKLAAVTARRWQALSGTQAVSQQEVDVQVAGAAAQKAQVDAAQQEVTRYAALYAFKRVVAPFDGVVTSRRTDVGDYVNAAGGDVGSRGTASELFSVADIHEMRVFVSVPQDYANVLKPGLTATLSLPQNPGEQFPATLLTNAHAVNPQTRTVVTELTVDNPRHELWPGTYASVKFTVPGNPAILILPEQALLFRAQGMQVALVDGEGRVHLQNVTVGLNLGSTVQVLAGLKKTDRVINNPSLGLLEGESVKAVEPVPGYGEVNGGPSAEPARSASGVVEPADNAVPEVGIRR